MPFHVVITGGGPIGLPGAIGFKIANPDCDVTVIEKYETYQRLHTLIMESQKLDHMIKEMRGETVPELAELSTRIKTDKHIRTNELEEVTQQLAQRLGVTLRIAEVTADNLEQQLLQPGAQGRPVDLIIGADGTKSIINRSLFPADNAIKYEFDFVLQLRYEIISPQRTGKVNLLDFSQIMARHGFLATEYVGHYKDGKTPVTMQMMIPKEDFNRLKTMTSKDPRYLFVVNDEKSEKTPQIPDDINNFLLNYLEEKIKTLQPDETLERTSIRASVNEAPATCVKQVVTMWKDIPVLLLGDASLGLSYFKGLNAGIEEVAKLMSTLRPVLSASTSKAAMINALKRYQDWFLHDFAPQKIKDVERYSFWQIRVGMRAVEAIGRLMASSMVYYGDESFYLLHDYLYLLGSQQEKDDYKEDRLNLYPHRAHDPFRFAQLSKTTPCYSVNKVTTLFKDYGRAYPARSQVLQDFKQPLVGFANIGVGLIKLVRSAVQQDADYLADGGATIVRGLLEVFTTPLAYLVKPITRGIVSAVSDPIYIEMNPEIRWVRTQGEKRLAETPEATTDNHAIYDVLACCSDIHRLFNKGLKQGQPTQIETDEIMRFRELRISFHANPKPLANYKPQVVRYFSLFPSKPVEAKEEAADVCKPVCK